MLLRTARVLACLALALLPLTSVQAVTPAAPPEGGTLRVDGKVLTLSHAYLFRVPDAFKANQKNAFVLLTPKPLDAAALAAAKTLAAVRALFTEGAQLEIGPDGHGKIWLCHDALGKGNCYQSGFSAFEVKIESNTAARVAGTARSFGGGEETVLETHKLFFDLRFDRSSSTELAARR